MNIAPKLLFGLLLGAAAATIWGGHAVVARLALTGQGFHVLDLLFARYAPAALLLAPLAWRERAAIRSLGWRPVLLLTLCGGAGNLALFIGALHLAPASHGATIAPMTGPVVAAFGAWWLLRERPTPGRVAALAVMVTGVLLIGWDGLGLHPGAWRGDLLLVLAGATWGMFTVLLRRWQVAAIPATATVSIASLAFVLPLFLVFRAEAFFAQPPLLVVWMMVAQGVLLGVVSMWMFARSVELLGATRAGTISVLVPVIGLIFASTFLGEPLGWLKVAGAGMAVGAMLVAVLFTGRRVG
jgi:drug/metabolite transporter (DMT)-like permease